MLFCQVRELLAKFSELDELEDNNWKISPAPQKEHKNNVSEPDRM